VTDSAWAVAATYGTLYEAEFAAGRLASVGIPTQIDQHDAVGLFGPGHGGLSVRGVALLVPTQVLHDARVALDLEIDFR